MSEDPIVAIGLLTQREVEQLGNTLTRIWPIDDSPVFTGLLQAIDEADRERRGRSSGPSPDAATDRSRNQPGS